LNDEERLRDEIELLDRRLDATRTRIRRATQEYTELRQQRRRLAARLKNLPFRTYKQRSGMKDDTWIRASDVLPPIARYILEHDGEHGTGGISNLAIRAGVSARTISDIINDRREYVTLETADMLLTAAGVGWQVSDLTTYPAIRGRPKKHPPTPPPSHYFEE